MGKRDPLSTVDLCSVRQAGLAGSYMIPPLPQKKEISSRPSPNSLIYFSVAIVFLPSHALCSTLLYSTKHTSNLTTMTASSAVLGWSYGRTGKINESGILDLPLHFINFFSGFIFHDVIDDEKNGRRESLLN